MRKADYSKIFDYNRNYLTKISILIERAKAENAVFLHFLKNRKSCGYYAESQREVDFILGDFKNPLPIEVKYISDFDWQDRRFSGVKLFLRRFPRVKEVLIISKDVETEIAKEGVVIKVIPAWKFLLRQRDFGNGLVFGIE